MILINTGLTAIPKRCEDCPAVLTFDFEPHAACAARTAFNDAYTLILRHAGQDRPGDCPLIATEETEGAPL